MNPLRCCSIAVLFSALSFISGPLYAVNYDVEVIIFEHVRNTAVGSSNNLLLPVIRGAQPLPAAPKVPATPAVIPAVVPVSNAPIQALATLRLNEYADQISGSKNHRLLYHGGWRQADLNQEEAPYVSIALGPALDMFVERGDDPDSLFLNGFSQAPLDSPILLDQARSAKLYGGIKVWVGRFLHFETLLAYTPPGASKSFSFKSDRRMRSRQLHYIDNSRVGVLTKIYPVDETAPN